VENLIPLLEERVLDALSEGVVVYDDQRRIRFWNRAQEEATGVPRQQVLGEAALEMFPFLKEKGIDRALDRAFAGETVESGSLRIVIPHTERVIQRRARYVPLRDAQQRVVAVVGVLTFLDQPAPAAPGEADDRIQSLALLANGLAARLANQLGVVMGYVHILRQEAHDNRALLQPLDVVEGAARQCFEISNTLFSFARRGPEAQQVLHLHDVLARAIDSYRLAVGGNLPIEFVAQPDLPILMGSEVRLRDALLHLLRNAHEATGGRPDLPIRVMVERAPAASDGLPFAPQADVHGYVRILVSDKGPGIRPDLQKRVQEPFFTTKGPHHLGLGLSVVQNTVRSMGGQTRLRSTPGAGTTVELFLPVPA
jgi:PAS domain S-box-containing protein